MCASQLCVILWRRIKRIYTSDLGRKIHAQITPIAEAMVEEELSGLTAKERESLTDILLIVKQRLQDMAQETDPIQSKELEKKNAE